MIITHEQYLVDEAGNRNAVVLPLAAWQQIKEELEELDDIRAYDEAKAQPSEPVPFKQAMREIQDRRVD
jgi:PHD/YefM family antitoxin component YafN of YafNO toxin-antitoxin module